METGLAVPCGVQPGRHHLQIYYRITIPTGHTTTSLIHSTDPERSIMAVKDDMLGYFIILHLTFPTFLIDCSCHQDLTKYITLLAFADQQQVQIFAPLAAFGGAAL